MIAIPLPFVVSLLLFLLAIMLWMKPSQEGKSPSLFAALCALTTAIVGLRWTLDMAIFRMLQPVCAALVPLAAWYCFSRAHQPGRLSPLHWSGPIVVAAGSLGYPYWHAPLDLILTMLYVGYGIALLRSSGTMASEVRLSDVEWVKYAEWVAGGMLLFSAGIDGALTLDFARYDGAHAMYILAVGYTLLLPTLALVVVMVSQSTQPSGAAESAPSEPEPPTQAVLSAGEANAIIAKLDTLLREKQAFLDPDLTLGRLSRKLTIPARQISMAVNQVHGRNLSKVLNEYRIEHAKERLLTSDESITQVYLNSGFQTKSNFNREFSRVTGQTPSAFRRQAPVSEP
ncbi:AraC family transcriptional regulator [Zobellella endophytica]|uniref:AraC family transcriptional regulator n=1 Tax=Zobellella endophytica TaxID=2116700 RepID=A0A2P7RCB2_9GAMM|nr:AraC family transcriptional regulator [Zobellella endophytica]PSJ47874.1 AraC family transcriptional regulator [Zobellella endophytica]